MRTSQDLDEVWGRDWPRAIAILDAFLSNAADFGPARDKLYAALLAYGNQLTAAGNAKAAASQFLRAQALLPDRGEAAAALAALTPTPAAIAGSARAAGATPPIDLNGIWLGSGWAPGDPRNNGPLRTAIRQDGANVQAILITGNDYIPAGQISWQGTLQQSRVFPVQVRCALSGYRNPYWVTGQIEIRSPTELGLTGTDPCIAGRNIRFSRE